MAPYEAANKDIVYIKDGEVKGKVKGGYTFEGYYGTDSKKVELPIYSVDGTAVVKGTNSTYPTQGFYTYTEKADGTLKLSAAGTNAKMGKTIESMSNNLLSVNGEDPFKTDKAVIVDLTDKAVAGENAYGANVTTLSALRRVVNMTSTEYTVTVDIYVNGDDEVVALFIKSILEDDGIVDEGTKATSKVGVTYQNKDGEPVANPGWANGDKVKIEGDGVDVTATFTESALRRAAGTWNVVVTQPSGWVGAFDGATLTLTAPEAGSVSDPVANNGAFTVTVECAALPEGTGSATKGEFANGEEPGNPDSGETYAVTGVTDGTITDSTANTKTFSV